MTDDKLFDSEDDPMTPHMQRRAAEKAHALAEASYVELAKLRRAGVLSPDLDERAGDGMALWSRLVNDIRREVAPVEGQTP